ncbi:MAG: arginine--tRNA ligase, partial [Candidatus Rokuibacteriota bacterium]
MRRAPREIARDLGLRLETIEGVAGAEVAGGGYLNIFFDRDRFLRSLAREIGRPRPASRGGKRIVEHTNINPNKAAHIGHLRNAVLGDTLVRCLEHLGERVEVQNYIDDTGVQVADLAVGFKDIRGLALEDVREIAKRCARGEEWSAPTRHFVDSEGGGRAEVRSAERFRAEYPFDHYCWDLYAEVAPFYAASAENAARRGAALEEMEKGRGPYAGLAALLSREMVLHHLRTMKWIGVGYDLLPRESDILALGFWERAFALLKETGAIRFADDGKAKGCWVMDLPDAPEDEDETAKIIVRSNGTVTYVGKDIAYQMWKFGLLGRDFRYRRFDAAELRANSKTDEIFSKVFQDQNRDWPRSRERTDSRTPANESTAKESIAKESDAVSGVEQGAIESERGRPEMGAQVWMTSHDVDEPGHPAFGGAARVYNVIDVRQSYL